MHIVLGATGHVGSAVASTLLDRGEPVTVVTRDARKAEPFRRRGANVAVADVRDPDSLRVVLRRGRSAFLLMPSADLSTDTVAEERRTAKSIARAVEGAGLQKVVVQSTYGAQPGEGIGDLGVLYELEQLIAAGSAGATGMPRAAAGAEAGAAADSGRLRVVRVVRGAYYMSNWDSALETARDKGIVHTFFPADFMLPMVAPADLGRVAARLLMDREGNEGNEDNDDANDVDHVDDRGVNEQAVRYVEGPAQQSASDVARAFASALGRDVRAVEIPRSEWEVTMQSLGFSPAAAASYARMMALTLEGPQRPETPERGPTTLAQYVSALVRREAKRHAAG